MHIKSKIYHTFKQNIFIKFTKFTNLLSFEKIYPATNILLNHHRIIGFYIALKVNVLFFRAPFPTGAVPGL